MQKIVPPSTIQFNKKGANLAEVVIEPFYPGFGVTVGNALRRVLLSSLDGAAIIGFKINGVDHEFSSIDYVKEDVVEMILNLKKVRVKIYENTDEDIKLNLQVSGEKVVTAGDITKDSRVEIISTDSVIATLTDKKAKLDMEIFVRRGRGYVTVEQRDNEKLEIGTIAIDSLYSPLQNVGFDVVNTRVGEMTNYEKLIMNIETDGSFSPEEAIKKAAEILVEQFNFFNGQTEVKTDSEKEEVVEEMDEKVEELGDDDAKNKKRGRPKKADK